MIARREEPSRDPRPASAALTRARRVVAAVLLTPRRRGWSGKGRSALAASWLFSAGLLALAVACLLRLLRLFW